MINKIRSNGKIWQRRSKSLVSGEIECPRCGEWKHFSKLNDSHFKDEYICPQCSKEVKSDFSLEPITERKRHNNKPKKFKPYLAQTCPHKQFFGCTKPRDCVGCYYNPEQKIAMMKRDEDDPPTNKSHWFYASKKHSEELLNMLDDIKNGIGLSKGGNRCYFKNARKDKPVTKKVFSSMEDEEENE